MYHKEYIFKEDIGKIVKTNNNKTDFKLPTGEK